MAERRVEALGFPGLVESLLVAAGLRADDAAVVADVYYRASLRGVGHHDIAMLPQRLEWMLTAGVLPKGTPHKIAGEGALEAWDADHALGELACAKITRRASELASRYGCGIVSLRHSNHFLCAAPYVEMLAEDGCIGIVVSSTDATMAGPSGGPPILGNNPLGFAAPRAEGAPLMLDIAMAYASLGSMNAHAQAGDTVPNYWAFDKNGTPSSDPSVIAGGGSLAPLGGYKGIGLGLLVEVLAGGLSGGDMGLEIRSGGGINTHGQCAIAIKIDHLAQANGGVGTVAAHVSSSLGALKARDPHFRAPGERSARAAELSLKQGIAVSDAVWEKLLVHAARLGVDIEAMAARRG